MLLGTGDMPARSDAIDGLIKAMKLYPDTTRFFIHAWTWGYEEVLERIAGAFNSKIHVDRYKAGIIASIRRYEPKLAAIVTPDESSRFHACEAKFRCSTCRGSLRDIVRIEFPEVMIAEFDVRHGKVMEQCRRAMEGKAPWPMTLLCPVARHSPLPELQSLVNLFRPTNVTPNTIISNLLGADYYVMIGMFRDHLGPGGARVLEEEAMGYVKRQLGSAMGRVPSRSRVEMHVRRVFGLQDGEEVNMETTARIFAGEFADQLGYGEVDCDDVPYAHEDAGAIKIEDYLDDVGARRVKRELEDVKRKQHKIVEARMDIMDTLKRQTHKHPVEYKVGDDRRSNARLQVEAFVGGLASTADSGGRLRDSPEIIDLVTEDEETQSTVKSEGVCAPVKRRRVTESPEEDVGVSLGHGGHGGGSIPMVPDVEVTTIQANAAVDVKPFPVAVSPTGAKLAAIRYTNTDMPITHLSRSNEPLAPSTVWQDERSVSSSVVTPSTSTRNRRRPCRAARAPGKYAVTASCKAAIIRMKTEQTQ